ALPISNDSRVPLIEKNGYRGNKSYRAGQFRARSEAVLKFRAGATGVSNLLCKRRGFVFVMGARGKGQYPFPRPSDVEGFCAFMTPPSPGSAFVPATES